MANVRALNKDKYNISNYRFKELYYFCLQYGEWRNVLIEKRNPMQATQYTGMPTAGNSIGNPTEGNAIECVEYSSKCAAVELAAKIADPELYQYIIYAVTNEGTTFKYLKMQKNIPCERDRYYDRRRKFFYILDKILRNKKIETI